LQSCSQDILEPRIEWLFIMLLRIKFKRNRFFSTFCNMPLQFATFNESCVMSMSGTPQKMGSATRYLLIGGREKLHEKDRRSF
jgi:hypothetical protein